MQIASTNAFGTRLIALLGVVCLAAGAFGAAAQQLTPEQQRRKQMHQPTIPYMPNRHIYPAVESAHTDLNAALAEARRRHKRVIVDFGGDWCGDCQVLDVYFHQAPNDRLLAENFVKVNINIGHEDSNLDIARRFGVPLHGVPALAVLDERGKVLFAQDKEFSDMRYMDPQSVTEFLRKWKKG